MKAKDIRTFIPCKDYQESRVFYSALGFKCEDAGEDLSILIKDECTFFLQKFYNEELANNLMLQLIVEDIEEAFIAISSIEHIAIKHSSIENEHWGRVVHLWGPSGELWHVTELKG